MPRGRPKKEIDKEMFQSLFLMGFDKEALLFAFDCNESELDDFCRFAYSETFDEMCEEIKYAMHPNQDPERPYTVYMHILPNGKKYVGVTRCMLNKRWGKGRGYWSNKYFKRAIDKYGWDNVQHAILYMRLTKEEAEQKEKELIKRFKTSDRRFGYNIESGGSLHKEVSLETREILRQRSTGKRASVETRRKMSESHRGEKCHFFGQKETEEHKQHLREIKSKKVAQMDCCGNVVQEYPSMTEAAAQFGVTRQAIYASCNGNGYKCKGYYWKFV